MFLINAQCVITPTFTRPVKYIVRRRYSSFAILSLCNVGQVWEIAQLWALVGQSLKIELLMYFTFEEIRLNWTYKTTHEEIKISSHGDFNGVVKCNRFLRFKNLHNKTQFGFSIS